MPNSLKNKVFGLLSYDYRWEKQDTVTLWGKKVTITTAVEAFPDEEISQVQEQNYVKIQKITELIDTEKTVKIIYYLNKDYQIQIPSLQNLFDYLDLQSVFYKQNGKVVALFSFTQDELGVGVELLPNFSVGVQDLYL